MMILTDNDARNIAALLHGLAEGVFEQSPEGAEDAHHTTLLDYGSQLNTLGEALDELVERGPDWTGVKERGTVLDWTPGSFLDDHLGVDFPTNKED